MNPDAWKRLPPDIQALFTRELNAAALKARQDTDRLNSSVADKLRRRGMQFNPVEVAGFKKKLVDAKYYDRWKAEFGPKAWSALERYANKLG
jgi:TRAP-type C4-dicarboxylate transport system substrate-binding protein